MYNTWGFHLTVQSKDQLNCRFTIERPTNNPPFPFSFNNLFKNWVSCGDNIVSICCEPLCLSHLIQLRIGYPCRNNDFSYDAGLVGATRGGVDAVEPLREKRFRIDHNRVCVGSGETAFRRAREAVRGWR